MSIRVHYKIFSKRSATESENKGSLLDKVQVVPPSLNPSCSIWCLMNMTQNKMSQFTLNKEDLYQTGQHWRYCKRIPYRHSHYKFPSSTKQKPSQTSRKSFNNVSVPTNIHPKPIPVKKKYNYNNHIIVLLNLKRPNQAVEIWHYTHWGVQTVSKQISDNKKKVVPKWSPTSLPNTNTVTERLVCSARICSSSSNMYRPVFVWYRFKKTLSQCFSNTTTCTTIKCSALLLAISALYRERGLHLS